MRWCILKLIVFRKSTSQRANSIPRAIYERRVYFALTSQKNSSAQVVETSKAKWTSILFLKVVFHLATFTYTICSEQHSFGRWIAVSFAANCTPFCVSCALTQHQMGQSSVRYKIAFCIKANHNDNYFLWLVGDWGIRRVLFMLKCLLKRIQKRTKNKFTTSVLPN